MTTHLDEPKAVRAEETLDHARLADWLQHHVAAGHPDELEVRQFPHGHSNLTYGIRWAGQDYVLRRPPFGNRVVSAHDMGREFRVLGALHPVYPLAPRPVVMCDDAAVIGAPFYLMERRFGRILRGAKPADCPPERLAALCGNFVDALADLHRVDTTSPAIAALGKPEGYVPRQVAGWTRRYQDAKTHDFAEMDALGPWLAAHLPVSSGTAVVHGDYKFDNVLLNPSDGTTLIAVLDWEMATLGDPLLDLGTTLAYWVEAGDPEILPATAVGPTALPGCFTRQQLADRYAQRIGRELPDLRFHYCFGLFKIAVIVQQIFARYARGATHDPRFANLHHLVQRLGAAAWHHAQAETFRLTTAA
jgi:aminoglycoside phosphotransferase (APT) family kinase protein